MQSNKEIWRTKVDMSKVEEGVDPLSYFVQRQIVRKNWQNKFSFVEYMLGDAKVDDCVSVG